MVFGTAGYDLVAARNNGLGHRLCVLHHLRLVGLEFRLQRFLERNRLGRDDVHQRAALDAGEDDALQLLLDVFARTLGDDDAATRTAQGLVRGGRDHVRVLDGAGVHACRDQAGHVRHVHEEDRAHLVGDGAHACPVDDLRIRAETADQHLRLVFHCKALDFVVIDQALLVHAVLHRVEQLAGNVDLGAVGQVAAVGQRHAQDGVARLQQGQEHGLVGLRARMRLHVGIVRIEQFLDPLNRQLFGDIHVFATAVVALAGVAFGVLVGQLAALGFHHPRAAVVFRRDQLDVVFLAAVLGRDRRGQFRVVTFDTGVAREHRCSEGANGSPIVAPCPVRPQKSAPFGALSRISQPG